MKLYGLKSCDSCRNAVRQLRAAGHDPQLVDIREQPLQRAEYERFYNALGDDLVNRRSTTWRGLSVAERGGSPVELLLAYPALMKRPVIEVEGQLTLGWSAATRAVFGV